jgi:hypothetical protein
MFQATAAVLEATCCVLFCAVLDNDNLGCAGTAPVLPRRFGWHCAAGRLQRLVQGSDTYAHGPPAQLGGKHLFQAQQNSCKYCRDLCTINPACLLVQQLARQFIAEILLHRQPGGS